MTKAASFRAGTPAAQPEVRPIDLRGPTGQLIRKITKPEADLVVESSLGFRHGEREVRLVAAVVRHDGNPRTWLGSQRAGRVRAAAYGHNERVCNAWPGKESATSNPAGGKS